MEKQRQSYDEIVRGMVRFVASAFTIGMVLGTIGSVVYYHNSHSAEKVFHTIVIMGALGFTFPMLTVSIRLMLKMFFQTTEQMENMQGMGDGFKKLIDGYDKAQEKVAPMAENVRVILEKAIPIATDIETIVVKAKGMAEDIEKIAHKVRTAADSLNGHLDIKGISEKLDKVSSSLETIANTFGGGNLNGSAELTIPEIDLFKPRKR